MTQTTMPAQTTQRPLKLAEKVEGYAQNKRSEIVAFAGSNERADKFIADMKVLCTEPSLRDCEPVTIFMSALNALQLGLSIVRQTGQAWVLPYKSKGVEQAQLQLGYKGWRLICKRGGYDIDCELVFDCDELDYSMDETGRKIRFQPDMKARETSNGAWVEKHLAGAIVWVTDERGVKPEFVPCDKLKKLRSTSKASDSPAWRGWTEEMYKGKAIKYVASKLPSENENLAHAVAIDNEAHTLEAQPRRTIDLIPDALAPEDDLIGTAEIVEASEAVHAE